MRPQRCQWHGKREFPDFSYADGFKKAEKQLLVEKLQSVPVMLLTQHDMEKLRSVDCPVVELMVEKTQQGFEQLLQALDPPVPTQDSNLYRKSDGPGRHVPQVLIGQR